jgi:TonB family protein
MNLSIVVTTVIAVSLALNNQIGYQAGNQSGQLSLEKQAIADTQQALASELDTGLPDISFANWYEKVVGRNAGVVWQLSECGEQIEAAPNGAADTRACVEINSLLADGRKVIVMIAVGTFKKGITGPPAFHFGVIEESGELRSIQRLGDLQNLLSGALVPASASIKLPELTRPTLVLAPNTAYALASQAELIGGVGRLIAVEEAAPPPPEPPAAQSGSSGILQGEPIVQRQPVYPRAAKRFNAAGKVEVQVTVSVTGRVTAAKAISGHPTLREAAEAAALQWEFKPTTVNGVPMETQLVLTFNFTVPQ